MENFNCRLKTHSIREEKLLFGKNIIITGANSGIGKETARYFINKGARVILACRNLNKAKEAADDIRRAGPGELLICHLDLASFTSIKAFANEMLNSMSRIDVLINNAGVMLRSKATTGNGFDMCFQSNYLGHFLLTNLLLDKLKQSAPSRIVNLTSLNHRYGTLHWNDFNLNRPNSYTMFKSYNQSKLALVLFTLELAVRLKGSGVNAYAVNPGITPSEIIRFLPNDCLQVVSGIVMRIVCKTVAKAAETVIFCAVEDEVENKSGLYYSNCKAEASSPEGSNEELARRLWECSMKMVSETHEI